MLSAIVFDLDGTLVDTNPAHVEAWLFALKQHGYVVAEDRIAAEIGKGGDKLVPSILGEGIERREGESLRKAHTDAFRKIAESTHLRPFGAVEELFQSIASRGLKIALATSSSGEELQTTLRSARVDWFSRFDSVATGDDAKESKPHPAILEVAIRKMGVSPAECVMVGDTPYDAETARDAGAVSLGFLCGKMNDAAALRGSGMRALYDNPGDLNQRLDQALAIASRARVLLTADVIEAKMREALAIARVGMERGEVPIGSVICRGDGEVIARGHNELNHSQDKTAHAEMVAFGKAAGKVSTEARDLILVSTLEPCVMCLGAAMEAAVDTILFGLEAPADGGRKRVRPPVSPESQMPRMLGGVLRDESRGLLKEFLNQRPSNPTQIQFVRQLLGET